MNRMRINHFPTKKQETKKQILVLLENLGPNRGPTSHASSSSPPISIYLHFRIRIRVWCAWII